MNARENPAELFCWEHDQDNRTGSPATPSEDEAYLAFDVLYGRDLARQRPRHRDPWSAVRSMSPSAEPRTDECEYKDQIASLLAAAWYDDDIHPLELSAHALEDALRYREGAQNAARVRALPAERGSKQ